jgi:cytochrome c oxidase subunit III
MSSSEATTEVHGGHAHHFASAGQQERAAQLGMWLFLVSEVMLFGGVFAAYALYRISFPETFVQASRLLNPVMGTVNTVVLITSSFTVALAVHYARASKSKLAGVMLLVSVAFALVFLGVKANEYAHHIHEGALPGRLYTLETFKAPGASLFFTFYFFSTGLHAVHVVLGMGVLVWIAVRALRGEFSAEWVTPVELSAMYWHLVDLVWIFLYPLLYLL